MSAPGPPEDSKRISLDEVEAKGFPKKAKFSISRRMIGFKIFQWLLWLVVGMVLLLVFFGWASYPTLDEFTALSKDATAAASAYSKARADWVASIKDLGQLFLVGPILPLLSAVLGYMFGRNESDGDDSGDA